MTLEEVLAAIQEQNTLEAIRPQWEESARTQPPGLPEFLRPERYVAHREFCGFDPDVDPLLAETARRIAADPALLPLAWHCHQLLFESAKAPSFAGWPKLEHALGDLRGIFYLLIALEMVPRVQALHRSLDVESEVTRDTCKQVYCFAGNYRRGHDGQLGLPRRQLYWLRHYVDGRLFRLGRLEYKIEPFGGSAEVFRHRQTGAVLALAPHMTRFDGEGYIDTRKTDDAPPDCWFSLFREDEAGFTGYPYSPHGVAVRRLVRLPRADWQRVLSKGDPVLDMHIPAGGGMDPEACADSMRRAVAFFSRHFPQQQCPAFFCSSWIFGPQLDGIFAPEANLVRFQRELYLYPAPSSGSDGLWFVFLQDNVDPATAPRDTSLRRGIADYLAAGKPWRGGNMLFLVEDLPRFGTQYYRSHRPPSLPPAV